ncbi:hypothetical protein P175DRAFT_0525731 [Aspergillus ochraceoroseus IBT 24754]|uniref:Uncharacterized protein n=3 Tax=Aspergillus subgen. Nidulantes TaxID=2720870 RepID=A0A0F8VBJ0_9EURO|nr:uncharacterized protein P175DRAFT_0525731 [Aspergillus ochraceoroseus IBT 24754]KKK11859.1 hypothetical protein AOCH_001002 [Aspergillus ochraceoroseus]KKK20436.1 hypothetical protein ARAM_002896 [Aspergillus rambellii]PTU19004.1 hypothetical protein P175DRAFT_0525731 [Aspergillus ochraceoroseus IBT 24754]
MSRPKVFSASARVLSWDEDRSPATQSTFPRLTPATVKMSLDELNSRVTSSYQMLYLPAGPDCAKDGSAVFVFTDLIESDGFEGKTGSFMTQGTGKFDATTYRVEGTFEIVPRSGKGDLGEMFKKGGNGSFQSDEKNPSQVNYNFVLP